MTILSDIEVEQAAQPHTTNKGEKPAGVTPLSSIAPPPDSQSSTSPSAEAPSVKVWSRRRLLAVAAALGASAAAAGRGHAQSYPTRPVRLVLPYTAGSPNDVLARLVAPHLTARLGQSVVVDNRPGGGTTIGVSAVMAAEGDGHTLLFSNSPSHQIAPLVNHNLAYDPLRDFVPLAIVGVSSNVIVIGNDVPATNVRELVAYAKANPGKLNFGFGQGTLPQLVGELFKTAAGLDIANVPYKGGAQAVTDLLGGRIQINIGTAATLLPLHRAGKVRMIAYTGTARRPDMADIPTMSESGYPAVTSVTYYGILGRASLPAEVVGRLNREVNEILQSADFRESIARVGFEAKAFSPDELVALFADEARRWAAIVKATGFQL